jgi:hypothetical protein
MEDAASTDLTGLALVPELLPILRGSADPHAHAMADVLQAWLARGAHRVKAAPADSHYRDAAAVAIMDEVYPRIVEAIFTPMFNPSGPPTSWLGLPTGWDVLPQQWASTPNSNGDQQGDAYGGGWEGYVWKILRQARGAAVTQPFSAAVTGRVCGATLMNGGLAGCPGAVLAAFTGSGGAYDALVAANGGTDVAAWTRDTQTVKAKASLPQLDSIYFNPVGIIEQPTTAWQNRPTYQQVVEFPVPSQASPPERQLPNTAAAAPTPLLLLPGIVALAGLPRRRRPARRR